MTSGSFIKTHLENGDGEELRAMETSLVHLVRDMLIELIVSKMHADMVMKVDKP